MVLVPQGSFIFCVLSCISSLAMSISPLKIPPTSTSEIPNLRDRYMKRLGMNLSQHQINNRVESNQDKQPPLVVEGHDLLCALVEAHLSKIPFENLAQHGGTGGPVSLDPEKIATKLLDRNRGGFCLELNVLFGKLLEDLGYHVVVVPAIVNVPNGGFREHATHVFLAASIPREEHEEESSSQSRYMVDVGFGEPPLHPLRYQLDEEQVTPEGMQSRIVKHDDNVELEWYKDGEWLPRLRWKVDAPSSKTPLQPEALTEMLKLVYDPESNFSTKLVVVRLTRARKQTLSGNVVKRTGPPRFGEGTNVVGEELDSLGQVREVLETEFGIPLDETETIDIRKLASQDPNVFGGF